MLKRNKTHIVHLEEENKMLREFIEEQKQTGQIFLQEMEDKKNKIKQEISKKLVFISDPNETFKDRETLDAEMDELVKSLKYLNTCYYEMEEQLYKKSNFFNHDSQILDFSTKKVEKLRKRIQRVKKEHGLMVEGFCNQNKTLRRYIDWNMELRKQIQAEKKKQLVLNKFITDKEGELNDNK